MDPALTSYRSSSSFAAQPKASRTRDRYAMYLGCSLYKLAKCRKGVRCSQQTLSVK